MNIETTVAAIARTKTQIKELQQLVEDLFATLPESQKVGAYPAGDYILSVRDNMKFDASTATKALPKDKLELILVSKPDASKARAALSGNDYALCQKSFGVVRDISAVTDEV